MPFAALTEAENGVCTDGDGGVGTDGLSDVLIFDIRDV